MAATSEKRGRTARIYTFLRGCAQPQDTRAIAQATCPKANTRLTGITLANMVHAGYLARIPGSWGNTRYSPTEKLPKGLQAKTMPAPVATPKPQPKPKPAAKVRPVVQPKAPKPRARPATKPKPAAAPAPSLTLPTRALPPRTHFHLAPAATSIPEVARSNRERIAADIAAFEKSGGRIQRLGPTQFFKAHGADNDE